MAKRPMLTLWLAFFIVGIIWWATADWIPFTCLVILICTMIWVQTKRLDFFDR